jgi:hypothetical protein
MSFRRGNSYTSPNVFYSMQFNNKIPFNKENSRVWMLYVPVGIRIVLFLLGVSSDRSVVLFDISVRGEAAN